MTWTHQKEERLRALWGAGKTASEISDEIGFGRSAVIGKARRMGLARRRNPIECPSVAVRFETMVEMIAEHDMPVRTAAQVAQLDEATATILWKRLCEKMGEGL